MANLEKFGLQTVVIPSAGLGSWQSAPGEVEKSIEAALDQGVKLIDTAYMYRNEKEIGEVINRYINEGKVTRKELFICTKLPMCAMQPEDVEEYCNYSLENLGLDYLDMFLIHTPVGVEKDPETKFLKFHGDQMKVVYDKNTDHLSLWREMEKLVEQGKVRAIGVSNFTSPQLERISRVARIPIAVNQVECHAYFQQKKLRETMKRWGIRMMAYAPLGSPGREKAKGNLLEDPVIVEIALAHSKTPAQVLLRFLVQQGMIVIPKSVKAHRIYENFNIFDFKLSMFEMAKLTSLDQGSKGRTFFLDFLKSDDDIHTLPEYPDALEDGY